MAHIYTVISRVSFVLAGVFLLSSCFFWFKFNIHKIIGDLSGRTAKKSIEQMRKANEESGKKHRASYIVSNRQSITEKIETASTDFQVTDCESEGTELLYSNNSNNRTELVQNKTEILVEDNSQIEHLEIIDSIVLIHSNKII